MASNEIDIPPVGIQIGPPAAKAGYNTQSPMLSEDHAVPTTREKLVATLVELQAELAELGELDNTTRQRLETTLHDIRAALAQPQNTGSSATEGGSDWRRASDEDDTTLDDEINSQSLAERLNDATRGLESTHPELSTTLGGVINALAQMGI